MKLTLDSLKKIDRTCDEISSLENLLAADERVEINEKIASIHAMVVASTETIDRLQSMKKVLDITGYTDAWYNQMNDTGLINFVELDMPKLFDNKANKTEVCQEGIGQTILDWLKKAWEIIKVAFGKIRDFLHWLVQQLGIADQADNKVSKFINDRLDAINKKYGTQDQPAQVKTVTVDPWYEPEVIKKHCEACRNLMTLIKDTNELTNIAMTCARNHKFDEMTIKHEIAAYLKRGVTKFRHTSATNPNNGFVINDSHDMTAPVILMYGVNLPGTRYESHAFQASDTQKIKDAQASIDEMRKPRVALVQELKAIDANIKMQHDGMEGQLNFVLQQKQPDMDEVSKMSAAIRVYNVLIPAVFSMLSYVKSTAALARANEIALMKALAEIK